MDADTISTTRATIQRIDLPRESRIRIGAPDGMPVADVVEALVEMAAYLDRVDRGTT